VVIWGGGDLREEVAPVGCLGAACQWEGRQGGVDCGRGQGGTFRHKAQAGGNHGDRQVGEVGLGKGFQARESDFGEDDI